MKNTNEKLSSTMQLLDVVVSWKIVFLVYLEDCLDTARKEITAELQETAERASLFIWLKRNFKTWLEQELC